MKVSVIIPTFNCEKYIDECLKSVIAQTFDDYEIIVADNNSTDSTKNKIKNYQQKNQNIRLIELDKNYKQGIARNIAIENANGEYILFVDGDDKAAPDFVEKMYKKISEDKTDITICNWLNFDNATGKTFKGYDGEMFDEICKNFENRIFNWQDIKEKIYFLSRMVWNKIYKKAFLTEKNLKFPGGIFFEDTVFAYDSLMKAEKISISDDILIYYRTNNKASVTAQRNAVFLDYLQVYAAIRENLKKQKVYETMKYYYLDFAIYTLYMYWLQIENKYKKVYYEKMKNFFTVLENTDIKDSQDENTINPEALFLLKRITENNYITCVFLQLKDKLLNKVY
ncbi:MAG: glycosyltransferase family 2 protein [Candidatus Gastranaerophilales bacterium]|nr:glycosyltransferase family 2 protein [Candidatus Gastranaerophilales bacterium]